MAQPIMRALYPRFVCSGCRLVPSLKGLGIKYIAYPALKRWAIIFRLALRDSVYRAGAESSSSVSRGETPALARRL